LSATLWRRRLEGKSMSKSTRVSHPIYSRDRICGTTADGLYGAIDTALPWRCDPTGRSTNPVAAMIRPTESISRLDPVYALTHERIAFLSGCQSSALASARLNAMNVRFKSRLPWTLTFSFARATGQPALEIWQGEETRVLAAQHALVPRARCNRAARRGEYTASMERA
jgi:hypothetical protein